MDEDSLSAKGERRRKHGGEEQACPRVISLLVGFLGCIGDMCVFAGDLTCSEGGKGFERSLYLLALFGLLKKNKKQKRHMSSA